MYLCLNSILNLRNVIEGLNRDQIEACKLVAAFKTRLLDFDPLFSGDLTQSKHSNGQSAATATGLCAELIAVGLCTFGYH